jgi:ABC-2 type transport system permease protein
VTWLHRQQENTMTRYLRLLRGYVKRYLLQWLASRSFAFTLVANQAVTPLIGLAVWTTALPGRNLSAYYAVLLFVRLMTVSYENHTFSGRIYNGELADDLLRPHPVVLQPLGENLALRIWHVIIGLPLLVGVLLLAPVRLAGGDVALALPALLLAAALQFLFTYTLALSAFWSERAHGITGLGSTLIFLLGGEAAPAPLLPAGLRPLVVALPFRAMHGFPAEVAAGALSGAEVLAGYGWQVLWMCVLLLVVRGVWRMGVRHYTAVGG